MVKSNDEQFGQQQKPVVFYRERSGRVPVIEWLENLPSQHRRKCRTVIRMLQNSGSQIRFPHAQHLREGIFELRTRFGKARYRLFYFWHADIGAVITHGIIKKTGAVPGREITTALQRRNKFEANPAVHTQEIDND